MIVPIIAAGFLGIVIGGVSCAMLRRPWNLKTLGIDAALAMIVMLISGNVLVEIEISRGVWAQFIWPAYIVAAVTVIARQLVRRFA